MAIFYSSLSVSYSSSKNENYTLRTVSLIIRFSLHSRNRETTSIIKFPEVLLIFLILPNCLKTDVTMLHLYATLTAATPAAFLLQTGKDSVLGKTSSHCRLLHPRLTESLKNTLHIRSVSFSYP